MSAVSRAVVSLGSNLEPRAEYLSRAVARLAALPGTKLLRQSGVRTTDPVDVPADFASLKFLNQVVTLDTTLEAHEFSRLMHGIEDELGRVRTVRNGPRTIDLDLIAFGGVRSDDPELTLPHPRAAEREFVMEPLREIWLAELRERYDRYVDGYRDPSGALPKMMQLKYEHTMLVLRNAGQIAESEKFTDEERFVVKAAALLHDTGRYEQLKRYDTFQDSESVDHAVFSHDIVKERGWLKTLSAAELAAPFEDLILKSVLYHNRRDLPKEIEDPLAASSASLRLLSLAAHTVRDADKLDIFRVLEDLVEHTDWRTDSRAFWNLAVGVPPNPEVVKVIRERRPVDYQHIRSLADFVLIQVGWILSGLHFKASRRLCRDRGHLDFRRRFLGEIGGGAEADALCDLAAVASA